MAWLVLQVISLSLQLHLLNIRAINEALDWSKQKYHWVFRLQRQVA